ncbi:MAG TPA: RNB domain-containing ribonuclease [Polyangia bacterium]|nr:RNB domain-containing ribonuclease [Polyangia bacterium]
MAHIDHNMLAQIAETAMREKGFLPDPPEDAVAEAAHAQPVTAPAAGMRDLRDLPWTSIDNPESQDLDQIEVAEAVAGGTRLYVGIADVDHFVAKGSAIDRFAGNNTTSVYTGVRTFPMLPERLSFHLSSLLAGEARPAIVIETLVHDDGTIGDGKLYPALVQNKGKLDYPSVSAWLDGKAPPPGVLAHDATLRAQVQLHDKVSRVLAEARRKAGALDVDTGEVRAVLDAHGNVTGLQPQHQDRAGAIIEELMIASNRTVAHALDLDGISSIRRVVKQPERWQRIVAYANEHGVTLPPQPSSKALAGFVERMRDEHPDAEDFADISLAIVKLMGRGEYVAHAPDEPDIGHFGLATMEYAHSTAPNRRYPDLVTQRLIKAHAAGQKSPYTRPELAQIAAHCSEMEAAAEKVERRVQKSAAAQLLQPQVGRAFDGIITGASDKGVFVRVLQPTAEGKVVKGGHGLAVGQRVRVRLLDVSVSKGFIDFERIIS